MKNKCVLIALVALALCGYRATAQDQNKTEPAAAPSGEAAQSITFDETPLQDVIKLLARQANINYVMDPTLTVKDANGNSPAAAPVSIRFDGVTPEQALTAVLENHGLAMVMDPKTKIARISKRNPDAPEPLFTKIYQLEYANPSNIVAVITPTLSARSKVQPDPRTGKLVVYATEKDLLSLDTLITNLDAPTRQVLIEARIVETTRNPRAVRGIDWSPTLEAQQITAGNNVTDGIVGNPGVVLGRNPGGSFQFQPTAAFLNADGVSAVLSFINKDSDAEIISMPRTVTQDNQLAKLEVTRAFPIFKVTPGSANVPASADITYTNLGTILQVTPRIASYSNISLKVSPEVSDIAAVDRQTLFNQVFSANIYAIRRMETTVMIPSGNTLVLGGLIAGDSKKDYVKVPVLGNIPGIGAAFRHQNKRKTKSNLLLFITPTIVESTDFQNTPSNFLKTPVIEDYDEPVSKLDNAKPLSRKTKTR